jgi:diguanylate cyclase (GGDEF)-like protein
LFGLGMLNAIATFRSNDRAQARLALALLAFAVASVFEPMSGAAHPVQTAGAVVAFLIGLGAFVSYADAFLGVSRAAPAAWLAFVAAYAVLLLASLAELVDPAALRMIPALPSLVPLLVVLYLFAALGVGLASLRAHGADARWFSLACAGAAVGVLLAIGGRVVGLPPALVAGAGPLGVGWAALFLSAALWERARPVNEDAQAEERRHIVESIVLIDPQTSLPTGDAFEQRLRGEWEVAKRISQRLAVLAIELDLIGEFEASYGPKVVDRCVRSASRALAMSLRRPQDFIARMSDDEFAVLLVGFPASTAVAVGERLRRDVEALEIANDAVTGIARVTISVGVATIVPDPEHEPLALLEAARAALRSAKASGRNRVTILERVGAA